MIGKNAVIDRQPAQRGDVQRTYAGLARAKAELGYAPGVTLVEGLRRFVGWFGEYGASYQVPG